MRRKKDNCRGTIYRDTWEIAHFQPHRRSTASDQLELTERERPEAP